MTPPGNRLRGGLAPSIRVGQRLVLTPSLRQSMEMWSYRGMALARMVKALADENPYLDVTMPPEHIPPRLGMDGGGVDALDLIDHAHAHPISLSAHLFASIGEAVHNPDDRAVALAMVAHVSPAGWLEASGVEAARAMGCDGVRLARLLKRLQGLEPAGIFARNLAECLRLQIEDRGEMTPDLDAILGRLDVLGGDGASALAAELGMSEGQMTAALACLRRCNPKPGAAFIPDTGDIFRPDVIIRPQGDGFKVMVNRDSLPEINLRGDMLADDEAGRMLKAAAEAQVRAIRSALKTRAEMLLAVGAVVVRHQQAFLTSGEVGLTPLTMTMVAAQLDCHKSTVSRIVADKLCDTPRGMLALRDFFSATLKQPRGAGVASRAVAARIIHLIEGEDPAAPLSDKALADRLAHDGISIARRTIAKYREQRGIDSWQNRLSQSGGVSHKRGRSSQSGATPLNQAGAMPLNRSHQ